MERKGDIVKTDRLVLRPFQVGDVDPLYKIQSDPKAMRYTFCALTRDDTKERMQAYASFLDKIGFAPWTVVRKENQQIIGWGGLSVDPFEPGWGTEVVYFIHPGHWNRGFATEIVNASLDHGFNYLKLKTINAFVHKDNSPSIRVLEKCGFEFMDHEPKLNRNHYSIRAE